MGWEGSGQGGGRGFRVIIIIIIIIIIIKTKIKITCNPRLPSHQMLVWKKTLNLVLVWIKNLT